ncbi:hypothetical protein [Saccharicrinis aurantiacus]|uniref:hypothetical protein n=1 Tax=Saccharicrinis aurantiacus TaxID=1849719 RepID=UPI0024902BB9|nr:hypothetical protein [Saccharicrinis aurantiacus]
MKTTTLFLFSLVLLTNTCFAQDSIVDYLLRSKLDFYQEEKIINQQAIDKADIVFIGESHGYNANHKITNRLINEYKQACDFTYIIAETDWAYTEELNKHILNEDTLAIKEMFNDVKGSFAWSKEQYLIYKNIIALNKQSKNKITYIGVDIPSGNYTYTAKCIQHILAKYQAEDPILKNIEGKYNLDSTELSHIKELLLASENKTFKSEDLFLYKYSLNNIINGELANAAGNNWDKVRDSCIFENYKALEKHLHLQNKKMIGTWGCSHTYQAELDSTKWFASQLKNDLNKTIYTYNIFYLNSKSMMPEYFLPGAFKVFKSKQKLYYNTKLQNSNSWVQDSWLVGTKVYLNVLKKVTSKNSITCFDIDKPESPFAYQPILLKFYYDQYSTTDLMQSIIVVRNSAPSTPFGANKK